MTASPPMALSEQFVLAKCDYFLDVHLWPLSSAMNPRSWLQNFTEPERPIALRLLDAFTYFSSELVDQLFVAAFQQLSTTVAQAGAMPLAVQSAWQQFCRDVVVTHVEGESPNPSDSGYAFARRSRQLLGIPEDQIMSPDAALEAWHRNPRRPLVFVDDFVGSGHQFEGTWKRVRTLPGLGNESFDSVRVAKRGRAYYCPLVATRTGIQYIRDYCGDVNLHPVHVLEPTRDSLVADTSQIWSDADRATAIDVIRGASRRAGIPDAGKDRWDGYEGLALAIGFEHSIPDATLPLFYWEKNGWKPLIRRR